jgi:plasmid stabilization system protein ParE
MPPSQADAPADRPQTIKREDSVKTPREAFDIAQRYWRNVPVRVDELARELNLGPKFDSRMPQHISGKIAKVAPDSWLIFVNAAHNRLRQRFTIAHEIGHFIFHRDLLEQHAGASDTLAYRVDDRVLPNPLIQPQQEWQANNFAANLLIPDYYLRAAQASGMTDVRELARHFQVTEVAMRIKLGLPIPEATPLFAQRD